MKNTLPKAIYVRCSVNRTFSNLPLPVLNMEKDMSLQMSFSVIRADEKMTAEEKLIAMTRQAMLENGSDDFKETFNLVYPSERSTHLEYLDANGVKNW